ncbi:restriction endonuclease subunit S, partial [Pseudomonas aeruginosa]|nr:restriction endonuclease subunit S [Pseudomonas aeruginosa]EKX4042858.1 restriction endonuclease subunit S [Pseudomonas aeruginosa]EKX4042861.1 restriction endonuclease subunit S [Pseudomonas aeruginosa]ELQ8117896.1 restriction endonuclease subunit S [Pseudomonas aeruginosa]ELQ8117899.1 restriction endonuclease subunit S [Pseudomonas aeruginosa]
AFRPLPALLPSVEVLAEFTKRVSPIFESIAANDRQINLLAEIRDTLLPKLISGEIRLPEAESIVRSAVNA